MLLEARMESVYKLSVGKFLTEGKRKFSLTSHYKNNTGVLLMNNGKQGLWIEGWLR